MISAVELVVPKLLPSKLKIRSSDKLKSSTSNTAGRELKSIKSLKENKDTRLLQADKGNCIVVLDDSEYKHALNSLQESGVYEPLSKNTTSAVETEVQELLSKYKNTPLTWLKYKLTPPPPPPFLFSTPQPPTPPPQKHHFST